MKKVIRLTENDLARIIKRVISEQMDSDEDESSKGACEAQSEHWYGEVFDGKRKSAKERFEKKISRIEKSDTDNRCSDINDLIDEFITDYRPCMNSEHASSEFKNDLKRFRKKLDVARNKFCKTNR